MAGILAGPWTWKRARSFYYLAVAFNIRQVRRLFLGRLDDGGARRFLENYASEGLSPLDASGRSVVLSLSGCISCGLCETQCPESHVPPDRWPAYARALDQAVYAALDLPADCPDGCRRCEEICPTGVTLKATPAFVRRSLPAAGTA